MRVVTNLVFTRDEVERIIPYKLVCETLGGKGANLLKAFSPEEVEKIHGMWAQARKWYLNTGVPEEVDMTGDILTLWWRLAEFCMWEGLK